MTIAIRSATEDDITAMYELSRTIHTGLYADMVTADRYQRLLTHYADTPAHRQAYCDRRKQQLHDPAWTMHVATIDDEVVGFHLYYDDDHGASHGGGLYVAPDRQGQGIGKALLAEWIAAESPDRPIVLEVIEKNQRAIGLYEHIGFKRMGMSDRIYFGEKMIRMAYQGID